MIRGTASEVHTVLCAELRACQGLHLELTPPPQVPSSPPVAPVMMPSGWLMSAIIPQASGSGHRSGGCARLDSGGIPAEDRWLPNTAQQTTLPCNLTPPLLQPAATRYRAGRRLQKRLPHSFSRHHAPARQTMLQHIPNLTARCHRRYCMANLNVAHLIQFDLACNNARVRLVPNAVK